MNEFDKVFEEEMGRITEGAFKSLATAGLTGLAAVTGANNAIANYNERPPITQKVTDETILAKTLPFTKWAEGYRSTVYRDSQNALTIGYGSNLGSEHIQKELEKLGYSVRALRSGQQSINEKDAV